MSLPISVVIPHLRSRDEFFEKRCLPSVEENNPAEIFIETEGKNACENRNIGAAKATQRFIMFIDDDSIIKKGSLWKMMLALLVDSGASFAYGDWEIVHYPEIPCPYPNGVINSMSWDFDALRRWNYIDTMSMMKREIFPQFDPAIRRYQDWDLWLRLGKSGCRGVYVPEVLSEHHHFDIGISASVPEEEALEAIKKKHGLT